MSETRKVIVFAELETRFGNRSLALKAYEKICRIAGFGNLGQDFLGGYPSLSLEGVPDETLAQIEKILEAEEPAVNPNTETAEGENA